MIDDECGTVDGMKIGWGIRSTRRKRIAVSLCPPQIPYDLNEARTRTAEVGNRRLSYGAAKCYVTRTCHGLHTKINFLSHKNCFRFQGHAFQPTACAMFLIITRTGLHVFI
jgi:hypothetical protein